MRSPRRAVGLLAALSGAFAACDHPAQPVAVAVRMENASKVAFDEATLYTLDGPLTYTDLDTGVTTPYVNVTGAYRIATTQVLIGDDTLGLQVIDYVGEDPLPEGRYTYVLTVSGLGTAAPDLTQVLRPDD
jgi:hypothetical protein